jgi:DNA-binding XRE family transcriptional regulator
MSARDNGEASQIMTTIDMLRRERGWTQFELALAVGVQPQTIYLWESGRRQPKVSQMRKLGKVFGMCSDEIDLAQTPTAHAVTADSGEQAHPTRDC